MMASSTANNRLPRYVQPGACVNQSTETVSSCALEKSACIASETFVSSRELHEQEPFSLGTECLKAEALASIRLGRCLSELDKLVCTGTPDSCSIKQRFQSTSSDCFMVSDENVGAIFERPIFGSCIPGGFSTSMSLREPDTHCLWNEEACDEYPDGLWMIAQTEFGWTDQCDCEVTVVGSCVSPMSGLNYCAVSADACHGNDTYLSPKQLQDQGAIECFLCPKGLTLPDELRNDAAVAPTTSGGGGNNNNSGGTGGGASTATTEQPPTDNTGRSSNNGVGWGVIIGASVGGSLLLFAILYYLLERIVNKKNRNNDGTSTTGVDKKDEEDGKSDDISASQASTATATAGEPAALSMLNLDEKPPVSAPVV